MSQKFVLTVELQIDSSTLTTEDVVESLEIEFDPFDYEYEITNICEVS